MKIERLDLHGCNRQTAAEKTEQNLSWMLDHAVDVLIINHGRGHHSSGPAVLKTELRKRLHADQRLREAGYRIINGESELPIALSCNEGNTLVVRHGLENDWLGDRRQQEKNQIIYSEEGKQRRKSAKQNRAQKRRR